MRQVDVNEIAVAAAVNDRGVLARCLARSPDITNGAINLEIYEDYATAGLAYNAAMRDCKRQFLILAHQDVYMPAGTAQLLASAITCLNAHEGNWGVAGVIGLDRSGRLAGRTWSSGLQRLIEGEVQLPTPAATLDEMLLVVNQASGIAFDPELPSFHLYATDIVITATAAKCSTWIIDLPVIHNSRPVTNLSGGYRDAWNYMRRKHKKDLPLHNLVCPVTRFAFTRLIRDFRLRWRASGRVARGTINNDAVAIARKLGLE